MFATAVSKRNVSFTETFRRETFRSAFHETLHLSYERPHAARGGAGRRDTTPGATRATTSAPQSWTRTRRRTVCLHPPCPPVRIGRTSLPPPVQTGRASDLSLRGTERAAPPLGAARARALRRPLRRISVGPPPMSTRPLSSTLEWMKVSPTDLVARPLQSHSPLRPTPAKSLTSPSNPCKVTHLSVQPL